MATKKTTKKKKATKGAKKSASKSGTKKAAKKVPARAAKKTGESGKSRSSKGILTQVKEAVGKVISDVASGAARLTAEGVSAVGDVEGTDSANKGSSNAKNKAAKSSE